MKRTFLCILTAMALVTSLPATVGTHPLLGGDDNTGDDAPDHQDEAWAIEPGHVGGDLLPPLDEADWYSLEVTEASRMYFELWSDTPVFLAAVGPDGEEAYGQSFEVDNTTGTWYFGIHAASLLPAHYEAFVKLAPVDDGGCHDPSHCDPCHETHHCHGEEPVPLGDEGAAGNITHEDSIDQYTLTADAFELVLVQLTADHDAGIVVSIRSLDEHVHAYEDPYKHPFDPFPRHEIHDQRGHGTSAEWFQPYATTLLVTVELVHQYHRVCDPSGCKEYEEIGEGGAYTLSVFRETDIPMPDLAVAGIEEIRRPIRTDLTPDVPNVVNERRTIVVDIANQGEGTARWGGYAFVLIEDERGPLWSSYGDFLHVAPLAPGEKVRLKVDWDTTTAIGDHTIRVLVSPLPKWFDADHANNEAEKETFVKVGGLL